MFLGFIAVVAMGFLFVEIRDTATGQYYATGGGEWYYGSQIIQMSPSEACTYYGYSPLSPQHIETNARGTLVSVCWNGQDYVRVPLVSTVRVFR